MCQAFAEHGINVTLAVPESKNGSTDIEKIVFDCLGQKESFSFVFFKKYMFQGRFNTLGAFWGLKHLLKTHPTDICYVRTPLSFSLALSFGLSTIFESHNALLHTKSFLLDLFWRRRVVRLSKHKKSIKIITISEALAEVWRARGVADKKILVLHDGFDIGKYNNQPSIGEARKLLGISIHKKIVLYTGSLYEDRGIENVLALARAFPDVQFMVVGGPEGRKLHYCQIAREKGLQNIRFTGRISHRSIPLYLAAADVLLAIWSRKVPTINYCSPLKIFEYMASGRIIVGQGFPTIKEVLTDSESAYLADPNSFDELAKKLRVALHDTYPSKVADNARKLAFKYYSWDKRAKKILNDISI